MSTQNYEILREAIESNSAAVLSLPSAGMARNHKTRFLLEAAAGFWVESIADADRPLVDALVLEKTPVGVAFKAGDASVMFITPILKREEQFQVNAETQVEALFLGFPQDFQRKQRRQAYRVAMPPQTPVTLRLWRIPEHVILRDRPLASLEILAKLEDLSVSGLGAQCRSRNADPVKALPNERLRIQMSWGDSDVVTEGRVMHRRDCQSGQVIMGVHFKKLEKDIEGRQTLAKLTELVGYLQREEIKRFRQAAG